MAASCTRQPQQGSIYSPGSTEREARKITKVTNNSARGMDETSEWYSGFILVPKVNVIYIRLPLRSMPPGKMFQK